MSVGMRVRMLCFVAVALVAAFVSPTLASADPPPVMPLGTVDLTSAGGLRCPSYTAECQHFKVTCPGVRLALNGAMAISYPTNDVPRGVVVMFSAAEGQGWEPSGTMTELLPVLQQGGLEVVQIAWAKGWGVASPGERAGSAAMACRPASIIQWIHDNYYLPLGVTPEIGRCGFCVAGESGGGSQGAYALSLYGLDPIVDTLITVGGPPFAEIARGCLHDNPDDERFWYEDGSAKKMDTTYGYKPGTGPCVTHDASFIDTFNRDGIDTGAANLVYPTTRIRAIVGKRDDSVAPAHAQAYIDTLVLAGTPDATFQVIHYMGHGLSGQEGLAVFEEILLAE